MHIGVQWIFLDVKTKNAVRPSHAVSTIWTLSLDTLSPVVKFSGSRYFLLCLWSTRTNVTLIELLRASIAQVVMHWSRIFSCHCKETLHGSGNVAESLALVSISNTFL